ncbi:VOC family protein [Niveispirillum fermenti]|uniref:VOC family protein n=1 Tax=Niveispirillum fermenti TaxID=1233113 RepID=UPI003A87A415
MIFRYTILYVDDVAASIDFFTRAFSLEKGFVHEGGDYGELATGHTKLAFSSTSLMRQLGKDPARPSRRQPCFEIALETDDVAGALRRALAAGAVLEKDVQEMPWGQTLAYVSDPNGYLIEICSPVQLPSPG